MRYDAHVHSTYSDGRFLWSMVSAAEAAGLDGVGIADHCNVSAREGPRRTKRMLGFNLDLTYERRRRAIEAVRDEFDVRVFDAVEMDFDRRDVEEIRAFLDEADFEYAFGSVHDLGDVMVHVESHFAEQSDAERRASVSDYFDHLVAMVESELFDVAAHVDLVERNPELRGYATEDDYRRVAEAFADSRTVPEVNAGRVLEEYGRHHPSPGFVAVLREHDVPFVLGSDSHEPDAIAPRTEQLEEFVAEHDVRTVPLPEIAD
jgi:histidinol-phosphatase (PHP family)